MTDIRLTDRQLADIAEAHPGDWYAGEWRSEYVEASGDDESEAAYYRVFHVASGTTLATLPDWAAGIALFVADAHEAVPALLAEVRRLTAVLAAEKSAHLFTLRQRNNRSNRITHLRDLALTGDMEALAAAAKDTLAASRDDHTDCGQSSEQPAAEETTACAKCAQPFDATDKAFDGHGRYQDTPYCRGCIDWCHSTEIADHRCVICT